jgi:hypothetical protein
VSGVKLVGSPRITFQTTALIRCGLRDISDSPLRSVRSRDQPIADAIRAGVAHKGAYDLFPSRQLVHERLEAELIDEPIAKLNQASAELASVPQVVEGSEQALGLRKIVEHHDATTDARECRLNVLGKGMCIVNSQCAELMSDSPRVFFDQIGCSSIGKLESRGRHGSPVYGWRAAGMSDRLLAAGEVAERPAGDAWVEPPRRLPTRWRARPSHSEAQGPPGCARLSDEVSRFIDAEGIDPPGNVA